MRLYNRIIDIINDVLEERQMTRYALARKMGRDPSWVGRVLAGQGEATFGLLDEMCRVLNISLKLKVVGK